MFKSKSEFLYVYMSASGYNKETVIKELEISEDQYNEYEERFANQLNYLKENEEESVQIGDKFRQLTSYQFKSVSDQQKGKPALSPYKIIEGELIELPDIKDYTPVNDSFTKVNLERVSRRDYSDDALSLTELSYLLLHTQGIRKELKNERIHVGFRYVASAGCRHPFETYLQINRCNGLKPGLYFYRADKHALVLLSDSDDNGQKCTDLCAGQSIAKTAAVVFMWTAISYRTTWRYCQRGHRYIYLDAGHVGQNLYLAGEALNLGVCTIGAFFDELAIPYLNIDGNDEFLVYAGAVGRNKEE